MATLATGIDAVAGPAERGWLSVAGAWLGVGTAPGALLVGAGLAARHGGVPIASLVLGMAVMGALLWAQGHLGLRPPLGEGASLSAIGALYFTPAMRRVFGALVAIGMTGWVGVNLGMGASALTALTGLPHWVTSLALGVPVVLLAIRGIQGWNRLALVTAACVLGLVALVMWHYRTGGQPLAAAGGLADTAADLAVMMGYLGVFILRAPDFTAGLPRRRDLGIVILLLATPMVVILAAGAILGERSASGDVIGMLAAPGALPIGNLLIALAVIAPVFTCFYSGARALTAATGVAERWAMVVMAVVGLTLAVAHFDLVLLPWLGTLGALLPPVVVPLLTEFALRRRGRSPHAVPVWPWLAGAVPGVALALAHSPAAMGGGFVLSTAATGIWLWHTRV